MTGMGKKRACLTAMCGGVVIGVAATGAGAIASSSSAKDAAAAVVMASGVATAAGLTTGVYLLATELDSDEA